VKFISIISPQIIQYEQVTKKLMSRVFDNGEKYVKLSGRNDERRAIFGDTGVERRIICS
jgi:hypothetical protein